MITFLQTEFFEKTNITNDWHLVLFLYIESLLMKKQ